VKTNKNDYIGAVAIAEAVRRPQMRFVPIKTDEQLDLHSLHRMREGWLGRRTAVINQIPALLLERGITVRKGRRCIDDALPGILEDADNKLSGALRMLLQAYSEMRQLQSQIDEAGAVMRKMWRGRLYEAVRDEILFSLNKPDAAIAGRQLRIIRVSERHRRHD
jgi:transposase